MSERNICDICKATGLETTLIRQCDFCGKNERDQVVIYQGENADICSECAVAVVEDICANARGIEARSGETPQEARPERRKPDGEATRPKEGS